MSRLRQMGFDDLIIMRELLNGGTYQSAADKLFLTQPAVSQRIRKLEYIWGEKNFTTKQGRRSVLTEHGREVCCIAVDVLEILEAGHKIFVP